MDTKDVDDTVQNRKQSPNSFAKHQKTKAWILWSHKASPVTREVNPGSKNRGEKSKEMGAGHRRMARNNSTQAARLAEDHSLFRWKVREATPCNGIS